MSRAADLASEYKVCVARSLFADTDKIADTYSAYYDEETMTNNICHDAAAARGLRFYGTHATHEVGGAAFKLEFTCSLDRPTAAR